MIATNKWIMAGLSLAIAIVSWASVFDWTSVVTAKNAAIIAGCVATLKFALNILAPPKKP